MNVLGNFYVAIASRRIFEIKIVLVVETARHSHETSSFPMTCTQDSLNNTQTLGKKQFCGNSEERITVMPP